MLSVEFMAYSIAKNKSHEFALQIERLCSRLNEQKHVEIASHLSRTGTGIGANVEEALPASPEEFVRILTSIVKTTRCSQAASSLEESAD